MAKIQEFKDELGIAFSPRVYRKGYLFKETREDSNGNISFFKDEKSFYKGYYDHDVFGIFSDLHFTDWDHSYGTTHHMMNVLPDDTQFFEEAWTKSAPNGSLGTGALMFYGTIATRGNLSMLCTSSQTLIYTKSNIIANTSTTDGCFTVEWEVKKGHSESGNNNASALQVKFGQFHVRVTHNLNTIVLQETGGTGVTVTNTMNSFITNPDDGHYSRMRLVFDMQRATKKCCLLINKQEQASITKTQTNGSTTDNEISFGYFSTPTSTSRTMIKYIRYHNSAFRPLEEPKVCTTSIGDIASSTFQPAASVYTQSGSRSGFSIVLSSTVDTDLTTNQTNTQSGTVTMTRNSDFGTNAIGNSVEFYGGIGGATSTVGRMEFKLEDGTRSCRLELYGFGNSTLNNGIKFNGVTVGGYSASVKTFRMVMRGTGASSAINCWLYVDGELVASQSNTTSSSNNRMTITMDSTSGQGNCNYLFSYVSLFNRPAFVTRNMNNCFLAYLNGVDESTTRYYSSNVTFNDLNTLLATPRLGSLQVFQKDLSWGDSGFEEVSTLEQRSSSSTFASNAGSPSWTAITVPTGHLKRDLFTKYTNAYFQVRIPFTKVTNELTYMGFHRQLDVSDYVTSWGQSTFERDFLSRKINSGDLRVSLMNPDDDFDTLRQRPDIWMNAAWETWIGARTDIGDIEYPDFIGRIEDIIYESNEPGIRLEISNIIKSLKDIDLNVSFQYPPFSKLVTYAGSTCNRMPMTVDNVDNRRYVLNSKYPGTIDAVYYDGVAQPTGWTAGTLPPVKIDFTTAPSGSVTVDFVPQAPFNTSNAGTILKAILQREAELFYNLNIDYNAVNSFEEDVPDIAMKNVNISQAKLFDYLEKIAVQSSGIIFINDESQDTIGFDLISNAKIDSETISDRNLSPSFHSCTTLTINNPVENVINIVDFTFNTDSNKGTFSYVNRRLVSDYDLSSPIATKKIVDVFGIRSPSRRVTNNPNTFFNITTHYDLLDSVTDLNTVVDRNYSPFGYRPPVYELNEVHTNIFIYSFRDILFLMRDSTTIADDTIEITRIQKNYDTLSGSIQGFSNKFIQFGGAAASLVKTYASPDSICVSSVTTPCVISGKTLNPSDTTDVNGYWIAVDNFGDADQSFAGT